MAINIATAQLHERSYYDDAAAVYLYIQPVLYRLPNIQKYS